jgi:signal transduction histidine kinase
VLSSSITEVVFQCLTVKDNCLWLGSDPNGITYCNLSPQLFHHFKNNYSSSAPIVKGIFTDAADNVYSCILFDGVQVFDKNGNYLNDFKKIGGNNNENLRLQAFSTIIPVNKDVVFIRCSNYIGFYNTTTGASHNYLYDFLKQTGTKQYDNIYNQAAIINSNSFLIESNHTIWQASFTAKKLQLKQKDTIKENISSLYAIDETHFLIGTEGGLFFYSNGANTYYDQIGKRLIKNINSDSFGNYWICTPDGLWQLNAQLQVIKHFTTDNGLPNNFTYGTLIDNDKLWVSTNFGISVMDINNKTFTNYTVADGLQSNEFNSGAFWKSENGKLYFGGINGITQIDAKAKINNNSLIPVLITQLKVNDKIWNADTALWTVTQLQLSYTNNTVSFYFSGILPSQSQQLEYRYKMEGADNDWVYAGKNRLVRYADLSPGNYTFKVAASLNNKDWSKETIISISITPPFWKTTWFSILIASCCILILWFIIRSYNKIKYKKQIEAIKLQQQLEEERQRISRDLHDNMGAYTSALIANVEKLKTKTGEDEDVLKMQSNAQQILGSLRETIWVLNNKEISIADFSDGFKNYCFKLLKNFTHISFDAQEDIQQNKMLTASVAIHVNKILQEAVQNIIKHSSATVINYSISCNNNLKIIITYNGEGFYIQDIKKGNGLENMQWRAKEAGAVIEIITLPQKGTTIIITK